MGSGASKNRAAQSSSGRGNAYARVAEDVAMSVGHETWVGRVAVPKKYLRRGATITDTALRGITLEQLAHLEHLMKDVLWEVEIVVKKGRSFFSSKKQRLTWENLEMYSVCTYFVKPLTEPHKCSFVDLVAQTEAQPPKWFVSHAWSTPFAQTVSMLNFHAQSRSLLPTTPYWICTFANNQHDLGELSSDLLETPFARAIMMTGCVGTLLLVDEKCTPMTRAWCVLEAWVTRIHATGKLFDMAAMIPAGAQNYRVGDDGTEQYIERHWVEPGPALQMDLGAGAPKELAQPKGGRFPSVVAVTGVRAKVELAKASQKNDLVKIRQMLAGVDYKPANPTAPCKGYDDVNEAYRALFRGAAIRIMAELGYPEELALQLPKARPEEINHQDESGHTALIMAVQNGRASCVDLLLANRAEVDQASKQGGTPLSMSAQEGQEKCMELLLAKGAALDPTDDKGATPLFYAASFGYDKCVELLLANRAAVNHVDRDGETALSYTRNQGDDKCVELLLAAGAKERQELELCHLHAQMGRFRQPRSDPRADEAWARSIASAMVASDCWK